MPQVLLVDEMRLRYSGEGYETFYLNSQRLEDSPYHGELYFQAGIDSGRMDPISIATSAAALASFAFRASKAIYSGVESVKNADTTLLQ